MVRVRVRVSWVRELRVVRSPELAAALTAAPPVVLTGAIEVWHVLTPSMERVRKLISARMAGLEHAYGA